MLKINSYHFEENEHLYGPGKRLVIFTQGCKIHCKGCSNYELWPFEGGKTLSLEEFKNLIKDLEGITLLGGEPLDQSEEVLKLIKLTKDLGKTVVLFTGYHKYELTDAGLKAWKLADIVISGRFILEKRNIHLQFRGSTNQRCYFHQGKYQDYKIKDGELVSLLKISKEGNINLKGFIDKDLEELLENLKK